MQSPVPIPIDRLLGAAPPAGVALVQRDRAISFSELDALVDRIAGGLAARGVRAGDRVVTWLPKSIEGVATLFGAARAGAVFVPANPQLKPAQVDHIVRDSEAALVLTTRSRATGLAGPALTLEDDFAALADAVPSDGERDPGSLAALLYTSGSTGAPKGVMLSHSNLWHAADSVRSFLGTDADDRVLSVLPHGFDYGLNQLTQAWAAGARAVLLDYLAPRDIVRAVAAHGITQLGGVPPLWHDLVAADWGDAGATLRTLTNSGGHLHPGLSAQLRALFPQARLHLMYGLTEAFRATSLAPELAATRPESVGKAIPHAEVMVVRPDGSPAGADEPGEMVQAGPLVAQGYWRDPARTAAKFRPAPTFSICGGVAVWSGDTVRRGADGLLVFVGRDDEMIKTGGYRVSPTEVEDAALAAGADAAVAYGEADDRLGQRIVLVAAGPLDAAALARALPGFMQPARIDLRDALPRLANGKLDRSAVRT